jgi:ankyrin repeat protein
MISTRKVALGVAFLLNSRLIGAADDDGAAIFRAIRKGDIGYVRAHAAKAEIEVRDGRGATPLMHAAAFGNFETLKALIDAGADVNARNQMDATALLWAAGDPEKSRILIERGADVKAQSKQGRTPLMMAAMRPGDSAIVELILSKGADIQARDRFGATALSLAARAGDLDTVELLIAKGADPNLRDGVGKGALFSATMGQNPAVIRLLLQRGANANEATSLPPGAALRSPNNGKNRPANNSKDTALHNAAAFGPVGSVRYLLEAGAEVNARDSRSLTPLSFALASEYPSLDIVRTLLRAGADVNVADNNGDTPLDWAEKFGYPEILAELKKAGAKNGDEHQPLQNPTHERPTTAVALGRALQQLETTSVKFFNGSGCVSCHHQNLVARAQASARRAGLPVNESVEKEQAMQMKAQWIGLQEDFLQGMLPGGGANRLAENLLGLKAAGHAPDSVTDAAIVAIAAAQGADGSWGSGEVQHRPPIAQSPFGATAKIVRVMKDYAIPARAQEFAQRIEQARDWLVKAKPVTAEDYSMRLAGLYCAGASQADLKQAARALLELQRPDGGWGGNPYMKSDAFATGVALTSLIESNAITTTHSAFRSGVDYLLSTQFPDGSWYVRSRSIKMQPYFESGFPFGHDQWISTAATAWAAQAIAFEVGAAKIRPAQER